MKAKRSAGLVVMLIGATLVPASSRAQNAAPVAVQQGGVAVSSQGTQNRIHRQGTRVRVYGRSGYLPPSAVRSCDAWYVQEYRPSGTVIVPRMRCHWVNG